MNQGLYQALKSQWNRDIRWFGIKECELERICEELDKSCEILINDPDNCKLDFYEDCKKLGLLRNELPKFMLAGDGGPFISCPQQYVKLDLVFDFSIKGRLKTLNKFLLEGKLDETPKIYLSQRVIDALSKLSNN